MIRSLVRKELRDQRPFLVLGLFLELLDQLSDLFTGAFAQQPLGNEIADGYSTAGILFLMVIAFALGTGLLTREHEEGTLEFLDSLPIGRGWLFGVKIAVGWGVLMAGIVLELVALLLRHLWFHTSLDGGVHLPLLIQGALLQGAVLYVGLALGVILSFTGRLSWMLAGMLGLFVVVAVKQLPAASILDPTSIALARFEGSDWRIPWSTLALHLTWATLALLLSLALFAGVWDRRLRKLWGFLSGPAATPITVATSVVGLVLFGLISYDAAESGTAAAGSEPSFPEPALGQYDSQHYAFRYPAPLSQRASPLFEEGDQTFQRVSELLGVGPLPTPIRVDLTGSAQHTAGLAFWNAIRMDLLAAEDGEELLAVLAHETTHVLAAQTVGAERAQRLNQLLAFNEGLSRHIQRELFPDAPDRDQGRTVAALLLARRQMRVEDVFNVAALAADQDRDLVYPFGEAIVQQLIRRYGKDAARRVLEATGRQDAPEQLDPLSVWQDAFQTAGYDLTRILYDVQKDLEREHARHRQLHDSLPRPKPSVEDPSASFLRILTHLDGPLPQGWSVACRFRADADSPPTDYEGPMEAYDGGCFRDRRNVENNTLWVQLGVVAPGGYHVYEPWVSIPLD
ncbi:MAG: ABC transporter permease [Myxococcota bacterium]|nr:ABC transporter permease [Myxococcota bacterium]